MSVHWGGPGAGHVSRWSVATTGVPVLSLDFLTSNTLDPRITFTRSTTATFVGSNGLIQTAAINAPRFDYNPVTLAPNGLLIEEQRTNLVLYSEQFENVYWTKSDTTVTANATAAPNGTTTADAVFETVTNSVHTVQRAAITITAGTSTTLSMYVKANGRNNVDLRIQGSTGQAIGRFILVGNGTFTTINSGTGVTTAASITPLSNGWYRVSVTGVASATDTSVGAFIYLRDGTNTTYAGDPTKGVFIWGAQLEAAAFATSYIPTVASQVTRTADVAVMTGTNFSSWYNQSEGTFVASADTVGTSTGSVIMVGSDDSNRVQIGHTGSTDAIFRIVNVGVSANPANIAATKTGFKAALAYKQSDAAASAGGSAVTTSSPTSMVAHTAAYLGANAAGGLQINGHIRTITYYSSRLTNAQLQALTA